MKEKKVEFEKITDEEIQAVFNRLRKEAVDEEWRKRREVMLRRIRIIEMNMKYDFQTYNISV